MASFCRYKSIFMNKYHDDITSLVHGETVYELLFVLLKLNQYRYISASTILLGVRAV